VKNMKRSSRGAIPACVAVLVLLYSPSVGVQATRPIVLKGALLIDGTGRPPVQNSVLVIESGKIRAAGPAASVSVPRDADVRDVSGKTIMPALIVPSVSANQTASSAKPTATSGKQTDPQAGTWKMNLEKSTFVPGGPHPTGELVTIEEVEGGLKVVSSGGFQYTAKYDGKDYPMTGSAAADGVMLRRFDPNTIETTRKKGGTVVTTNITFISGDGKTRGNVFQGKNAQGQPITWIAVFDKQ
jgi:hypothetical protein